MDSSNSKKIPIIKKLSIWSISNDTFISNSQNIPNKPLKKLKPSFTFSKIKSNYRKNFNFNNNNNCNHLTRQKTATPNIIQKNILKDNFEYIHEDSDNTKMSLCGKRIHFHRSISTYSSDSLEIPFITKNGNFYFLYLINFKKIITVNLTYSILTNLIYQQVKTTVKK